MKMLADLRSWMLLSRLHSFRYPGESVFIPGMYYYIRAKDNVFKKQTQL